MPHVATESIVTVCELHEGGKPLFEDLLDMLKRKLDTELVYEDGSRIVVMGYDNKDTIKRVLDALNSDEWLSIVIAWRLVAIDAAVKATNKLFNDGELVFDTSKFPWISKWSSVRTTLERHRCMQQRHPFIIGSLLYMFGDRDEVCEALENELTHRAHFTDVLTPNLHIPVRE